MWAHKKPDARIIMAQLRRTGAILPTENNGCEIGASNNRNTNTTPPKAYSSPAETETRKALPVERLNPSVQNVNVETPQRTFEQSKVETPQCTLKQSKLPYVKFRENAIDEVGVALGEGDLKNDDEFVETPQRTLKQSKMPDIKSRDNDMHEVAVACGEGDFKKSLFRDSICSLGSVYNNYVLGHPEMFPDGTCCIKIDKVHGREHTKPRIGWAHKTNNKKSYCLGVHQCPHYGKGYFFRLRPRHHRREETRPTGLPSPANAY